MDVRTFFSESAIAVVLALLVSPVGHEDLRVHEELWLRFRVNLAHVLVVGRGKDRVGYVKDALIKRL